MHQPVGTLPSTAGTSALMRSVEASTSVTVPRYLPKKRLRSRVSRSVTAGSFIAIPYSAPASAPSAPLEVPEAAAPTALRTSTKRIVWTSGVILWRTLQTR